MKRFIWAVPTFLCVLILSILSAFGPEGVMRSSSWPLVSRVWATLAAMQVPGLILGIYTIAKSEKRTSTDLGLIAIVLTGILVFGGMFWVIMSVS